MHHIYKYIPTMIVASVIAYFSFIHNASEYIPRSMLGIENFDKYLHALMYMLGAGTLILDMYRDEQMKKGKLLPTTFAVGMSSLFGGMIEIMQKLWFSPRTAEWIDWFADTIGALLGAVFALLIIHIYEKRINK